MHYHWGQAAAKNRNMATLNSAHQAKRQCYFDRCFTLFLNRIHLIPAVKKRPLRLVLPYLGTISMQTRNTLQTSIKVVPNCCKLQVIFKSQNKLCNNFRFKDPVHQILT